jgi:hypothetical protein
MFSDPNITKLLTKLLQDPAKTKKNAYHRHKNMIRIWIVSKKSGNFCVVH